MTAPLTPARQQYLDIKALYPDAIVWYRLGDFYEMFDDDARTAAAALRITLTSRSFGKDCRVPMCGVPHHAQARFLARLVRQGFSVAICEQVSPPGKGLVEREVVRVVTPGTIGEPELLRTGENNYLCAVARRQGVFALAHVDVSTGEFGVTETPDPAALAAELDRLQPAECLVEDAEPLPGREPPNIKVLEPALWDGRYCEERLHRHLGARALHMAGCHHRPVAQAAAGAILGYLERTNRTLLPVLHHLRFYQVDDAVVVDSATRSLLLGKHSAASDRHGSLQGLLDCTVTAMGARLLGSWLRRPLRDRSTLLERQAAIAALRQDGPRRQAIRAALRPIGDLERLTARVGQERATAEELVALAAALEAVPGVLEAAGTPDEEALRRILEGIDAAPEVAAGLLAAVAEPGADRLIRAGHDAELDRLAAQAQEARERLLALEAGERERTGIRSLKVSFNSVFGYYIEVSNPNLGRVPPHYVRKQTLAHSERFVTAELLHWEAALADAEAALQARDRSLFQELQRTVTRESPRILGTADCLARLDVLCALAETAESRGYTRPELSDGTDLHIVAGRHPLVEASLGPGAFIPNDCTLGGEGPTLAIVTGPNMGGKSTYLRQVALIVYLAQIGSFVPAAEARIGLADRIFARIGAHDDLAAGHSTFLLEMAETAAILRLATPRSLVLLDEIGRGTTSSDGQAIARAVAEHLHEVVGARTLFATHYYDLARAAEGWLGATNIHVRAEEHEGQVVFLYRIAQGIADKSFALHVARMAGMPEAITLRAADLLAEATEGGTIGASEPARPDRLYQPDHQWSWQGSNLEASRQTRDRVSRGAGSDAGTDIPAPTGVEIEPPIETPRPLHMADHWAGAAAVVAELLSLDLASTTPIEALNVLYTLQQRARTTHAEDVRPRQPARGHRV